jgi:hypothetical protein
MEKVQKISVNSVQLRGGLQVIVIFFLVSEWIHLSRGSYRITVRNRILLYKYAK